MTKLTNAQLRTILRAKAKNANVKAIEQLVPANAKQREMIEAALRIAKAVNRS